MNTSSTAKYPDSADLREANDAQDGPPEILSDVTPDNLWIPGAEYAADGHHWFPRAIYRGKQALKDDDVMSPETRKVFDDAKSGRLHVYSINGMRHAYDAFGREYEAAVRDLLRDFMSENNIAKKSYLTPDHARAILGAIERSQDPRILAYNNVIRLMRLFPWLRGGGRE